MNEQEAREPKPKPTSSAAKALIIIFLPGIVAVVVLAILIALDGTSDCVTVFKPFDPLGLIFLATCACSAPERADSLFWQS